MPPKIILIAGESGSGKTTFIDKALRYVDAIVISMDNFYFGKNDCHRPSDVAVWGNDPNYCDIESLVQVVTQLKQGEPTLIPQYSFIIQDRVKPIVVIPTKYIIVEGLWALTFPKLRELADRKIYIEAPEAVRIERRIGRDDVRGHSKERVLEMAPCIERLGKLHVAPYKTYADLVIKNF